MIIAITQSSLQELAAQELGCANAELVPPPFGTVDATALAIARRLKAELMREGGGSELYADTLITLFGIHLLRNYTLHGTPDKPRKGGLDPVAAAKVREYLNENFTQQMSVQQLAAIAGLSPKHFIQAFSRTFGAAPHRYLLDLRLDFAERLLAGGTLPIIDIAYLSGFSSQSHLTAAMRKHRGRTPAQLRAAT